MKYLNKSAQSQVIQNKWRYATTSHRPKIRAELLREQQGFCAYTERYVAPIDACEIEHFDNRLKGTADDDYWNWYAVHRWINQQKRPIAAFLPILLPHDRTLPNRIRYQDGQFQAMHEKDLEAQNLIKFLMWNDPTLALYRNKFVARLKQIKADFFPGDKTGFLDYISSDPENLNFITVLEAELGLSLT